MVNVIYDGSFDENSIFSNCCNIIHEKDQLDEPDDLDERNQLKELDELVELEKRDELKEVEYLDWRDELLGKQYNMSY